MHVRLTEPVGSFASRVGSPISAVLIAPVESNGGTVLPAGTLLNGRVKLVRRVGFGILHERAELDLDFSQALSPGGSEFPISTQVAQVDNGREQVDRQGYIRGVRTTSSISYRVSGYVRTLLMWNIHAELVYWAIKMMIVQVPEPEIYYPAGAELTLTLTRPLAAGTQTEEDDAPRKFTDEDRLRVAEIVDGMPYQTSTAQNRPSDLINVMLVGSHEQVVKAFTMAGWTSARASSFRAGLREIRAVAEERGLRDAPMSELLLNDNESDMSWQKGLNDTAKRHHVRIWKQGETWDGQEIWAAAATRDVDYAYFRPGRLFTHRVAPDVDEERDKIVADLAFTSCVSMSDLWGRPHVPHRTSNATGDLMTTDARIAVIQLNDCSHPRPFVALTDEAPIRAHGGTLQRLARREILSLRNDIMRDNVYWRSYEGVRMTVAMIRSHHNSQPTEPQPSFTEPSAPRHSADSFTSVFSFR